MATLNRTGHKLADPAEQVAFLSNSQSSRFKPFEVQMETAGLFPLKPTGVEIMQVNVGKMCNQTCKHCHVDAGPDRKEIMTRTTMQQCLDAIKHTDINTVDLTGGAPEMNPEFRWFVEQITAMGKKVMVRCNLTIILANPKYHDLPEFFKKHNVEVISSLPYFSARRTDAQRGDGVFERSIKALKMLNEVGYGKAGSGLVLNLVYNPTGAFLPSGQESLEREFKDKLQQRYDVEFNNLFAITNLPISRFLEYLVATDNYYEYIEKLANAFNPAAAEGVMCRNTLSVGWDGFLYDCDFNQMLDLKFSNGVPAHISEFDLEKINNREITINQHCYGCTAGAGSSCGGEVVK